MGAPETNLPDAGLPRWAVPVLVGVALLAFNLAVAAWAPPMLDEIYYWCWAQHIQPSYFDHPPMTALLIRPSLDLFGNSILALRLPAILANLVVLAVLWRITRPRCYLGWALATPLFALEGVVITPDTGLMLFWALYLGWLVAAHRRLTESPSRSIPIWMWLAGGLALGGAGLSKYTAILLVPTGFVSFLLAGSSWRRWLAGYILHGAVAGLAVIPVLLFNIEHDFAPFRFQLEHATSGIRSGFETLGEFVGVQIALMGTAPLVLLPWAWRHIRSLAADPATRAGVALYALPFTFFLGKSVLGPVQPNWAMVCYLGFWPIAAGWYADWARTPARRWIAASAYFIPMLALVVLVALALSTRMDRPLPGPLKVDRIASEGARFDAAAQAAEAIRSTGEKLPVYTASYQWTALLRYHGIDARQIEGATRPSNFTLIPTSLSASDRAFVVQEGMTPAPLVGYELPQLVWSGPIEARGQIVGEVAIFRYVRFAQP
jgi:4-amino-4-deoxy-L-arabinose transferase-like glycosyltransferase